MSITPTTPELPAPTNLREAKKQKAQAKERHPASGTAKKATPAKAPAPAKDSQPVGKSEMARKAPVQSGKAKLKWVGDVAKLGDVEIGKRVEQKDGTFHAVVKVAGKAKILGTGYSRDKAYSTVTRWYHYGEMPVAKKVAAKSTPKRAS